MLTDDILQMQHSRHYIHFVTEPELKNSKNKVKLWATYNNVR